MTRRSWFAILLTMLGLGTSSEGRASEADGPSADSPFPYPTYKVTGAQALSRWAELKQAGGGYP